MKNVTEVMESGAEGSQFRKLHDEMEQAHATYVEKREAFNEYKKTFAKEDKMLNKALQVLIARGIPEAQARKALGIGDEVKAAAKLEQVA